MLGRHLQRISTAACLALLLSGCPSGSSGTNSLKLGQSVHIDASGGSDTAGDGSQSSPYRTFSKLASLDYAQPTTIYLKRGEIWHESLTLPASNVTVDAYGTGALPVIDGSREISGWSAVGSGGLYAAAVALGSGEALGNLSENGIMMTFLPWDTDSATTFAGAPAGSYSYDYPTDTLYIKPASTPSANTYLASTVLRGVHAANRHDIDIRNVRIRRMSLHGIEFDDCLRCSVEDSVIADTGGAVIGPAPAAPPDYLYAGNGVDYANASRDGRIANVSVTGVFDSGLAVEVYRSNTTASSFELGNAQLSRCGFAGVEISVQSNGGTNTNSVVDDVNIHDAQVSDAGKGWSGRRYASEGHGIRIVADAGAGTMSNIRVTRSSVSQSAGDGIKIAGEVGVAALHRIDASHNTGAGIDVADPNAATLGLELTSSLIYANGGNGIHYDAPFASGLRLYQDTLVDNGAINLAVYGQANLADIRNDLFYASSPRTDIYSAAALANPTLDHNCYNDTTNMFGYNGTAYSTVAAFRAATGFEPNGLGSGSVGLTNPAGDVFTLTAGSACIGLGDGTLGIGEDYTGAPFANPPASGAYAHR